MTNPDYDVIVIGSGAAGLAAAVEARDAGASVLVCEAGDRLGGSSAASGGLIFAGDTSLQRELGIHDTPEDIYHYYMMMNRWEVESAVARRYADECGPAVEWLMSLGLEFEPHVYTVALSKVPRGHMPREHGFGIIQVLSAAISRGGVETALNTRVDRLLTDDSGAVVGIHAEGADVTSNAVIIACGGLGAASREMKREYWPNAAEYDDKWYHYIGVDTDRGDAITLCREIGAEIAGHNCGLLINSSTYCREPEGLFPGWPVYVNKLGRRFVSEKADYSIMAHNINVQPEKILYVIMDEAAFSRDPKDPRYLNTAAIHKDIAAASLEPEWLAKGLEQGEIFKADTLAELAEKVGIPPRVLEATISEYNEDVDKGHDSHFLKDPAQMVRVEKPPFYAAPRRAGQLSTSAVGPRINADAKVYSTQGSYVPGLYAAGEAAGGMWTNYIGSGSALGTCMVFGRVAGRSAAARSRAMQGRD